MPDNVSNVNIADSVKSGESTPVKVTYDSAMDSYIDIDCDGGFTVAVTGSTDPPPAPAASGGLTEFRLKVSRTGANPTTQPDCVISFSLPGGTSDIEKRVTVT